MFEQKIEEEKVDDQLEDDFLAEILPGEEVGAEIVLEDPGQADYQIQKIARLKKKQDEIKEFVGKQTRGLQVYLERRLSILQKEIDWRSQPLEMYVRDAYRRSEGKTKSLDLPHGKLKLIKQQDKFECNEPVIFQWAGEHPESAKAFITTKPVIQKDKLKVYVKETGEVPEGLSITPADQPKFHLEFKNMGDSPLVLLQT